jgi:hypothetical protein
MLLSGRGTRSAARTGYIDNQRSDPPGRQRSENVDRQDADATERPNGQPVAPSTAAAEAPAKPSWASIASKPPSPKPVATRAAPGSPSRVASTGAALGGAPADQETCQSPGTSPDDKVSDQQQHHTQQKSPKRSRRSNRRSPRMSPGEGGSAVTAEVAAPKEPAAAVAVEPAPTMPVEAAAAATLQAAPDAHEDTAAAAGEEPAHVVGEETAPVATESWPLADAVDVEEASAGVAAAAPVAEQPCVADPGCAMPAEDEQGAGLSATTPSSMHATGTPVAMPVPVEMAAPPRLFVPTYHPAMYPYGVRPQMVPLPGGGQGGQVPLPGDMQRLHTLVPINMAHGGRPINSPQVANPSPQMVAMHTLPGHPTYQVRLLPSLRFEPMLSLGTVVALNLCQLPIGPLFCGVIVILYWLVMLHRQSTLHKEPEDSKEDGAGSGSQRFVGGSV